MYETGRGAYRDEILVLCAGLWNPDSGNFPAQAARFPAVKEIYVELLRLALETPSTAGIAASLAEQWEVGKELEPALLALLRRAPAEGGSRFAGAFLPALRLVASGNKGEASAELEDVYIALLNNSRSSQGVEVSKQAALALGSLRSENPDAIRGLIKGLFVVSTEGRTAFKESLRALLSIGPPAVPFLVDVLESGSGAGRVEYLRVFAVKNGVPDWKWRVGMRIPMVLAQLRDERAAGAIVSDITAPVIEPAFLPDRQRMNWTIAQTNRIKFDSWALMSTFNKDVTFDALRAIRDRNVEGSARLQLCLALAFNFTPEALDTLFRVVYEAGPPTEDLPSPTRESDFVIRFLQVLAYAVDHRNLERFQSVFVDGFDENFGDVERAEDIQEKLSQVDIRILLRVPVVCRNNRDCYLEVLKGNPWSDPAEKEAFYPSDYEGVGDRETKYILAMARTKAALVLGRWEADEEQRAEIVGVLAEVYSALPYDSELYDDLRRSIMLGFERQGRKDPGKVITALENLIAKETGKGEGATVWNQRLQALQTSLEHRKEGK